jgi:hypothetical protein
VTVAHPHATNDNSLGFAISLGKWGVESDRQRNIRSTVENGKGLVARIASQWRVSFSANFQNSVWPSDIKSLKEIDASIASILDGWGIRKTSIRLSGQKVNRKCLNVVFLISTNLGDSKLPDVSSDETASVKIFLLSRNVPWWPLATVYISAASVWGWVCTAENPSWGMNGSQDTTTSHSSKHLQVVWSSFTRERVWNWILL